MAPHPDPLAVSFTSTRRHDTYPFISKSNHTGHSVFISGASRGIGFGIAASFAKAGASNIAIAARSNLDEVEKQLIAAAKSAGYEPPKILKISLDVTSLENVDQAVKAVEKEFGKLDILINNAGYLEKFLPVAETDPNEWWTTFEINIKGVYLVTRAFLPLLLKGGEKTIVNITSIGAHLLTPGASGYQVSKNAILRFTEFLQTEYGEQGILTHAVHPGGVATELAKAMPENMHAMLIDTPELVGDTISWLTEDRKDWLAARYISSNWDMSELVAKKKEIIEDDKLKMRIVI